MIPCMLKLLLQHILLYLLSPLFSSLASFHPTATLTKVQSQAPQWQFSISGMHFHSSLYKSQSLKSKCEDAALVCAGCCYEVPWTAWLIHDRNLLLTILNPGSPKLGSQHGLVLEGPFLRYNLFRLCSIFAWQKRGWGSSLGLLSQDHTHSWGIHPDELVTTQRLTSQCHHMGV